MDIFRANSYGQWVIEYSFLQDAFSVLTFDEYVWKSRDAFSAQEPSDWRVIEFHRSELDCRKACDALVKLRNTRQKKSQKTRYKMLQKAQEQLSSVMESVRQTLPYSLRKKIDSQGRNEK